MPNLVVSHGCFSFGMKGKYHIPWTCLPQAHLGGLPTLSLTTNSSWLPWGRVAMPLISPLMPVPQPGIRPSSCTVMEYLAWKVVEMCIAGVTNFPTTALNDRGTVKNSVRVRCLVFRNEEHVTLRFANSTKYVNLCVTCSLFHSGDCFLSSLFSSVDRVDEKLPLLHVVHGKRLRERSRKVVENHRRRSCEPCAYNR